MSALVFLSIPSTLDAGESEISKKSANFSFQPSNTGPFSTITLSFETGETIFVLFGYLKIASLKSSPTLVFEMSNTATNSISVISYFPNLRCTII